MSELYFDYIKTRLGQEVLQDEAKKSFCIFQTKDEEFYLQDLYIDPYARERDILRDLTNQIKKVSKERGCKYVTASVIPSALKSTESMKLLIWWGFELISSTQDFIILKKTLKE